MRRAWKIAAPLSLWLAASLPARAGEPFLLKDLNLDSVALGADPRLFSEAGARPIFRTGNRIAGFQVWGSDGTAPGTEALVDDCPENCGEEASAYGRTDRLAFFRLRPNGTLRQLWATDGTKAGTFRLTSAPVEPVNGPGTEPGYASTPGRIYFVADDSVHGEELWVSDGTPAGTRLVADLRPGLAGATLSRLTALGDKAVFVADDGRGASVWVSDGTPAGTRLLLDPNPRSPVQESPGHLRQAGRFVYFTARVAGFGRELWRTDGTPAGTARVADLVPGAGSLQYVAGWPFGDRLLFVAGTPANGKEMWITNGTKAGTAPVTAFPGADPFAESLFPGLEGAIVTDLGARALFLADDGVHGLEVWSTDGRRSGTRLAYDLCPGACSTGPSLYPLPLGNLGFFYGGDRVHGRELWVTDGLPAGTKMVRDFCPGPCHASILSVGPAGPKAAIVVNGADALEVWSWAPAAPEPQRVATFDRIGDLANEGFSFRRIGRRLYLGASTDELGKELWRTNLAPAGTALVADLAPGRTGFGSFPSGGMPLGEHLLFFAHAPTGTVSLWRTDGTEAGTEWVTASGGDPYPAPSAQLGPLALYRDTNTLWRSDGSASGTFPLTPIGVFLFPEASGRAVPAGARAYFSAVTAGAGHEPWVTDGTVAGTRLLADLQTGPDSSSPLGFAALDGKILFRASTGADGEEIWSSDGTPGGTRIVKDPSPQPGASSLPTDFVAHAGHLYFTPLAVDPKVVWKTDGTEEGTVPAIDGSVLPGVVSLSPIASTGPMLFLLDDADLYVAEGTSALARKIWTSPRGEAPFGPFRVAGGRLYFGDAPGSLWTSDGTAAGTERVRDPQGIPIEGVSREWRVVGERLVVWRPSLPGSSICATGGTPAVARCLAGNADLDDPLLGGAGGRILYRAPTPDSGLELWAAEP